MKTFKRALCVIFSMLLLIQIVSVSATALENDIIGLSQNYTEETQSQVYDESFGIDMSTPLSFNAEDGVNPYGSAKATNLNAINELSLFQKSITGNYTGFVTFNFNENNPSESSKSYLNPLESGPSFFNSSSNNGYYNQKNNVLDIERSHITTNQYDDELLGVSALSFDPNGTGKNDHIFYYGYNKHTYIPELIVAKAEEDPYQYGVRNDIGLPSSIYKHMKQVPTIEASGLNSVVTGDFDGDGKDTAILYSPDYGVGRIIEYGGTNTSYLQSYMHFTGSSSLGVVDEKVLSNVFKEMTGADFKKLLEQTSIKDYEAYKNMPMIHLTAGDITGDNIDELVITVSFGDISDSMKAKMNSISSFVVVLSKNINKHWELLKAYSLNDILIESKSDDKNVSGEAWSMISASSSIGDFLPNDNGAYEIITVGRPVLNNKGYTGANNSIRMSNIAVTASFDNKNNRIVVPSIQKGSNVCTAGFFLNISISNNESMIYTTQSVKNTFYRNERHEPPVSLGCVAFDGIGTQEYIAVNGEFYKYSGGTFIGMDYSNSQKVMGVYERKEMYYTFDNSQPIIGNFSGINGQESVFYIYYDYGEKEYFITGFHKEQNKDSNVMNFDLLTTTWSLTGDLQHKGTTPILVSADYDDDALIANYTSKEHSFVTPQIFAVLEVAPYFSNLDYTAGIVAGTKFDMSYGKGTEDENSTTVNSSVFIGYDFKFPGSIFGVEAKATFTRDLTYAYSSGRTYEVGMSFDAAESEEHQVVMMSTPVVIYHYDVILPNGEKSTMDVQVPSSPVYSSISIEEYNAVAKTSDGEYPIIGEDVINSTAGDPTTYRTPNSLIGKNTATYDDILVDVGSGSNFISQRIVRSSEMSVAKSVSHGVEIEAAAHMGVVTIGGSVGESWEDAHTITDLSEVALEGTVGAIPKYASEDYGFSWQLVTWDEELTNGKNESITVPVIGYYVANVKSKIPAPILTAQSIDQNDIALTWVDPKPTENSTYEIYRVNGDEYFRLFEDEVITDTHYTVGPLTPNTPYDFVVKASDGVQESYYSNIATAKTYADSKSAEVVIDENPTDQTAYVNEEVTFSLVAKSFPTAGQPLKYQWQKLSKDSLFWEDIEGASKKDYTFTVSSTQDDGTLYRCEVENILSANPSYVVSNHAILNVKSIVETKITLLCQNTQDDEIQNGDKIENNSLIKLKAHVESSEANEATPNALVRYHIYEKNSDGEYVFNSHYDYKTNQDGNTNNTMSINFLNLKAGVSYKVYASTVHSGNLGESKSNEYYFDVIEALHPLYVIDNLNESYMYQEKIQPSLVPVDLINTPQADVSKVVFEAYQKEGNGYLDTPVIQESTQQLSLLTLLPNDYLIKAFYDEELIVQEEITVTRKDVTIKAPIYDDEISDIESYIPQGVATFSQELDNPQYGTIQNGYENLFKIQLVRKADGYYNQIAYNGDEDIIADFKSKYNPNFVDTYLNVDGLEIHSISYEAIGTNGEDSEHGMLLATSSESGVLNASDKVFENEDIMLKAITHKDATLVIEKWLVNGQEITEDNMGEYGMMSPTDTTIVSNNISKDTHFVAVISHVHYAVTVQVSGNGLVSPNENIIVEEGENQEFTFTPDDGYILDKVIVNGEEVEILDDKYTLNNVISDVYINVSFIEDTEEPTQEPTTPPSEPTQPTTNDEETTIPTGDSFELTLVVTLLILSLITAMVTVNKKRKES